MAFLAKQPKSADVIASASCVVISKMWCPFCSKAKKAIAQYVPDDHPQYKVFELEDADREPLIADVQRFQDEILALAGSRSVPKVYLKGDLLGGGDDIVALDKTGQLRQKLVHAGLVKDEILGDSTTKQSLESLNVRRFVNGKLQQKDEL